MTTLASQRDDTVGGAEPRGWPGFFVVGTGRCGSTLLRKLLRVHPDLHLPKETHWIPILHDFFGAREIEADEFFAAIRSVYMAKGKTAYARILKENATREDDFEAALRPALESLPRRDLASIMDLFYGALARANGASLWGDKTPDYGLCMGLLQRMWPDAKFLHIVRDGRDVALSMSQVLSFQLQVAWGVCYWPSIAWERAYAARLDEARRARPAGEFFELWRRRLLRIRDEAGRLPPSQYMEIEYDGLLADPRATLDRISSFLGLPVQAGWIDTAAGQVRSGDRRKNADDPRYRALGEEHGETLRTLGFEA
ncbi:MAG: sulfotransferase family protein [Myxococcota bacterium]